MRVVRFFGLVFGLVPPVSFTSVGFMGWKYSEAVGGNFRGCFILLTE